jgi:putative FmdB family regulatory protein
VPLYEYECKKCGHRFEKIMKFSDEPIKVCPKCGGEVEQMVSAPAVQFKGSGWYVTDYAKKSGSGAAKSSSGESASSTDSSTNSGSDSKSESSAPSGDAAKSAAPESKNTSTKKKSDKQ